MMRDPSRYYRRHMRRTMRRGGGIPVMFLDPRQPLTLIAMAAIGRWLYRHRSAFLPFVITAAAFITAANLHRYHRAWWPFIAAFTATVTLLLALPRRFMWSRPAGRITTSLLAKVWEACGIDRPIERAYAATVIGITGEWLAIAVALSPIIKPLPQIAGVATVVLGIPWWAHRRRRARVRALRTVQAWPGLAENMGLPGSRITSIVVDAWGWTGRVMLRKGTSTDHAITQIPSIESGLGTRPGSARIIPDPKRADRFILRIIEKDPHAEPLRWSGPGIESVTKPIELGLFEDGRPVPVTILRRNVLVGGMVGAGKSGVLNLMLAALAACHDVLIWGVDLKGGMELQPWAQCLDKLATTPQQAIALYQDAIAELERRAALMAAHGRRLWEPTSEMPALIIVVDEYAELPAEAREYADSLARRGRAVAVNMLAATQRPSQQAMGNNAVRSQMDVRICLRVRERRDVDLILGQGAFNAGWHAHRLTQPGTFLISAPELTSPERARAYLITDAQVTAHAHACALRRPHRIHETRPERPGEPQTRPAALRDVQASPAGPETPDDPQAVLWGALRRAGPQGISVASLVTLTGKGRTWVYERLREHAQAGRAVQTIRGHWRAADDRGQADA